MSFIRISHRGDHHHYLENSLEAFQSAYQKGLHAFETDIRLTKDKKAVLFHDSTLQRLFQNNKKIESLTFSEFKAFSTAKAHLISLEELFINFPKAYFNLELKVDAIKEVAQLIQKYKMQKKVVISSFSGPLIASVKSILPHIPTGQLSKIGYGAVSNALRYHADMIIVHNNALRQSHIKKAHKHHLSVWTWPVNTEQRREELKSWNINGMMTDIPELLS